MQCFAIVGWTPESTLRTAKFALSDRVRLDQNALHYT